MARINFNPQQVRPFTGSVQVLPAGKYTVEIVSEKEQTLKDGKSRSLVFDYQVVDGQFRGQRIRDNINLWNVNPDAVNLAQSILCAIANACGVQNFMDTQELHRRPFDVQLSTRQYNGREYNSVDDYSVHSQTSQQIQAAIPAQPSAAGAYWS